MKKLTSEQIRNIWVTFFEKKGHKIIKSASLIPQNDPTLLWINAGVATLKQYFDGSKIPPSRRLTNAQKCLRTNDIENVGNTARHQTFFEMLGNFSIGDYFKKEAIEWGYELITDEKYFGFDINKLYFTYYPTDIETRDLWLKMGIDESRIIPLEENFWEIGQGPCGPCTEILYDRGEKYDSRGVELIKNDIDNNRYVEIWNIVFSSFNAEEKKKREEYKELPSKNIDTGAGLERIVSIIQDCETNFETDLFMPIINHIEKISNIKYVGQKEFKIIADHIRALTFAISDGALLSNEGRGYVLRRLLRRALKSAHMININKPFLYLLVDDVVNIMGGYYSDLLKNIKIVKNIIKKEEEKFLETLEHGEKEFLRLIKNNNKISGSDAFKLYDTYGFPIELTLEYASEHNVIVDIDDYNKYLDMQKQRSRENRAHVSSMEKQQPKFLNYKQKSEFVGYDTLNTTSEVIKVFREGIILDKTPFYAEGGGQIPDTGTINGYDVLDVVKLPNLQHMHILDHKFKKGDIVKTSIQPRIRELTMYNHSATHLIHRALKDVLGEYVNQHGSKVGPYFLRFDFNCYNFPSEDDILSAEKIVKQKIKDSLSVEISYTTQDQAIKSGAIALFGEKYEKIVRMVNMSNYSIELCGGTHVENTNWIKDFSIVDISSIGSGMFRIFAVSGNEIKDMIKPYLKPYLDEYDNLVSKALKLDIEFENKIPKLPDLLISYQDIINYRKYIADLSNSVKQLEKDISQKNISISLEKISKLIENEYEIINTNIEPSLLKSLCLDLYNKKSMKGLFTFNIYDNKLTYILRSDSINCSILAKEINTILNSKGGGRPDLATGGGIDLSNIDKAINHIKEKW